MRGDERLRGREQHSSRAFASITALRILTLLDAIYKALDGRWGHSFEEDHDGLRVYRPAGFDFPRARGRGGIEFRPDGSFVDWTIGRGDAGEPREGTWVSADDDRSLEVTTAAGESRTVRVVRLDGDRQELDLGDASRP